MTRMELSQTSPCLCGSRETFGHCCGKRDLHLARAKLSPKKRDAITAGLLELVRLTDHLENLWPDAKSSPLTTLESTLGLQTSRLGPLEHAALLLFLLTSRITAGESQQELRKQVRHILGDSPLLDALSAGWMGLWQIRAATTAPIVRAAFGPFEAEEIVVDDILFLSPNTSASAILGWLVRIEGAVILIAATHVSKKRLLDVKRLGANIIERASSDFWASVEAPIIQGTLHRESYCGYYISNIKTWLRTGLRAELQQQLPNPLALAKCDTPTKFKEMISKIEEGLAAIVERRGIDPDERGPAIASVLYYAGLNMDGSLIFNTAEVATDPIALLGLPPAQLDWLGLDQRQTVAALETKLKETPTAPGELHEGLQRYKLQRRWIDLMQGVGDEPYRRYAHLLRGLGTLFDDPILDTPLSDLGISSSSLSRLRSSWATRHELELETLGDLPGKAKTLAALVGVGPKTIKEINDGLWQLANEWNWRHAGLEPRTPERTDPAASDVLQEGLDELAALFKE